MLSGPTKAVLDKTDGQSWLPEFNTPGISLDLPPLDLPPLDLPLLSLADANSDKHTPSTSANSVERPNEPAPPASPQPEADVYANYEYADTSADDCSATDNVPCAIDASLAASAESPQIPTQSVEPVQFATPKAPASPNASESGSFIDRLRLDFDFLTDPAIDAITTSSLFVAPVQESSVDENVKQEPSDLSAQHKAKTRRTSIAGMLMRRASKYMDATSAVEAPDFSAVCAASFSEPISTVADTSKVVPAVSGSASVSDEAVTDVPSDARSSVSAGEPQSARSTTSSQLDVAYSMIERPEGENDVVVDDSEEQPESALATDDDASGSHSEPVASVDSETDPVDSDSLPAPIPPMARTVEKRSSRILNGITRKVNHVRQTTSMVLRRSVGSRLSMAPGKSVDNAKQPECLGTGQLGGQEEPPKYSSNENVTGGASITEDVDDTSEADGSVISDAMADTDKAEADDVAIAVDTANSTESIDTGSAADASNISDAGSSSTETASSGSSSAANDRTSSIDVETPESDASDHDEASSQDEHHTGKEGLDASDKDGLDAKPTFSRRLGMVRRGTNEAVRNGVSRVKHIFASKRPVAA
ncbi:hypothetical protein IWW43_004449 [Coemansia sp. RSA 1935]|nr:hypothetical protein IWW43_004449 [Coemansia sp. RSA 1935]